MKKALINIIIEQNELMNRILIDKSVEEYVDKILKNANIVTYCMNEQIAGFVAYYANDLKNKLAYLTMVCVAPKFSRKGIARQLLRFSIDDITEKGFNLYALEVSEDNYPAIQLYKNAGFEISSKVDQTLRMTKLIYL